MKNVQAIKLSELLNLLNTKFLNHYHTEIIGGFNEPFYKAAIGKAKAQIQFSHDYIRSALHELAHWCVAGEERRKCDDFGYWYAADGRTQSQQDEFFKV
ncbi:MAG TPA: diaminobutyrate-2-oxoglutarate aminotransferase, partial [Oceanospirillales bacterium]|nr:diaminobutyrate-2-oxoglutarate aminotransferase [Oceanospirillales bacterium]